MSIVTGQNIFQLLDERDSLKKEVKRLNLELEEQTVKAWRMLMEKLTFKRRLKQQKTKDRDG